MPVPVLFILPVVLMYFSFCRDWLGYCIIHLALFKKSSKFLLFGVLYAPADYSALARSNSIILPVKCSLCRSLSRLLPVVQ